MDQIKQQQLGEILRKAERNRKLIGILRIPIYGVLVLWMAFVLLGSFIRPDLMAETGQGVFAWFIPAVIILMLFQFIFIRLCSSFSGQEREVMRQIVADISGEGRYHEQPHQLSLQELRGSKFFGRVDTSAHAMPACVFTSMELPTEQMMLKIYDLGVAHSRKSGNAPKIGILEPYMVSIRMLFTRRLESSQFGFRGLFARVALPEPISGCVVVLPDNLESKMGHMAGSVQGLQQFEGNRLVQMEDPEFEDFFAVYATDEVVARRVLTPAVMRTMTSLRRDAGRDAYFSFNGNTFSFAFSMPEGVLTICGAEPAKAVSVIENKIKLAQRTLNELITL